MLLSEYPGYQRGIAQFRRVEDILRSFAMTRLPERINGLPVRQLTPRHLDLLLLAGSPFLITRERRRAFRILLQAEDVAQFLWIVSLDNPLDGSPPPAAFFKTLRPHDSARFRQFYRAIDRYYDRATLDRPAASSDGRVVGTSLSASTVNRIAAAYGWPAEVFQAPPESIWPRLIRLLRRQEPPTSRPVPFAGIIDMPIARLYQYWRWIVADKNPSSPLFSRFQDAFRQRVIIRWRARAQLAGFGDDVRAYLVSIGKLPSFQPSSVRTS